VASLRCLAAVLCRRVPGACAQALSPTRRKTRVEPPAAARKNTTSMSLTLQSRFHTGNDRHWPHTGQTHLVQWLRDHARHGFLVIRR